MNFTRLLAVRDFAVIGAITERINLRLLYTGCQLRRPDPELTEAGFTNSFNAWRMTQVRLSVMDCIRLCEKRLSQGAKMPWESGNRK